MSPSCHVPIEVESSVHLPDENVTCRFERKLERLAEERGRRRTKSIEQEAGPGDESPSESINSL